MTTSEQAGRPADPADLVDLEALQAAYYARRPDADDPAERVAFGTSGHRGSSLRTSFNEAHIVATTAAICAHRREQGIRGPLFMGRDTHALSEPAFLTALEVLVADGVDVRVDAADGFTPTPALSHAILAWNRAAPRGAGRRHRGDAFAQPARRRWLQVQPAQRRASGRGRDAGHRGCRQRAAAQRPRAGRTRPGRPSTSRLPAGTTSWAATWTTCPSVIDVAAIAGSGLRIGVDPLGGRGRGLLGGHRRAARPRPGRHQRPRRPHLRLHDPRLGRPDPHGPLVAARHGPTHRPARRLRPGPRQRRRRRPLRRRDARARACCRPNHFLAAAAWYLFGGAREWGREAAIGKTLVSSSLQDRIAAALGRRLFEVPVGFKWFVDGLLDGSVAFGGEESAGMSFLRRDGRPWSTDKDGIIACLLAAELTARTGRDPGETYGAAHGALRCARLPAHRRARHAGPEGGPGAPLGGRRACHRAGRATPSWRGSPRRPATARPSAA